MKSLYTMLFIGAHLSLTGCLEPQVSSSFSPTSLPIDQSIDHKPEGNIPHEKTNPTTYSSVTQDSSEYQEWLQRRSAYKNLNTHSTPPTTTTSTTASTASIFIPPPLTKFSYQLSGALIRHNVRVHFVDLFDHSESTIRSLSNGSNKVICYFSAGSSEDWRLDYHRFPSSSKGKNLDGWPGEKWLNTKNSTVRNIMKDRMNLAKQKGCDGVDPDNVDSFDNNTGFNLSVSDAKDYLNFLANHAHSIGLSIGLKNSASIANSMSNKFDFAVVEECGTYNECHMYSGFTSKSKAIFRIEYRSYSSALCNDAKARKETLIFGALNLNGNFSFCN